MLVRGLLGRVGNADLDDGVVSLFTTLSWTARVSVRISVLNRVRPFSANARGEFFMSMVVARESPDKVVCSQLLSLRWYRQVN